MGSFRVVAVLGAALLIASCSSQEPGTPLGAGTTTPTTTGKTSAPPTTKSTTTSNKPSVTRPKTIDLSGTDGCKVISGMPAAEFGWQGLTPRPLDSKAFPGMKDCILDARPILVS